MVAIAILARQTNWSHWWRFWQRHLKLLLGLLFKKICFDIFLTYFDRILPQEYLFKISSKYLNSFWFYSVWACVKFCESFSTYKFPSPDYIMPIWVQKQQERVVLWLVEIYWSYKYFVWICTPLAPGFHTETHLCRVEEPRALRQRQKHRNRFSRGNIHG